MVDVKTNQEEIFAKDFVAILLHHKRANNYKVKGKVLLENSIMPGEVKLNVFNCSFLDEVDFTSDYLKEIFFIGCEFQNRLLISGKQHNYIKIFQCKFLKHLAFKKTESKKIEIDECFIENSISTQLQEFICEYFYFRKNSSLNDIFIKPDKISDLVVIEGSEKHYLITYSGFDISQPLKELLLVTYSNYRTDYLIRTFSADKLQIIGELKDSILNVNNCRLNHGILQNFINQGVLIFNSIKALSDSAVIVLKDSLIGKAQINNTDFTEFKKVIFSSSNILELVPVNIKWCLHGKLESKDKESLKENYRQLKIVATKNDDIESKLFFHRLEMITLLQIHKKAKSKFNDMLILKTNYWSNDFGLSWIKALYWFIGISILFYTTIKIILGERYFNQSLIFDEIGRFLIFINPIHQFDKVFNIDPLTQNTNGALLCDGLSKIFGAYIIYQFISSFRKYSRK